ncbi:MAG: rRNA adenine methyltransferase [Bacteroidota bacterium]
MEFDSNNPVIQLCVNGMEMEAQNPAEAKSLFLQAWNEAASDFEKFTAAHYVARHQPNVTEKLKWDEIALSFALKINDSSMQTNYPSLYLNIGKCYEELNDIENAEKNYQFALSYATHLPADGYGQMIRGGIDKALQRISAN